jgi:hypothetical protein
MIRALPLALAAVAMAATAAPVGGTVRLAAVLPFLVLAPGLSLSWLLRLGEGLGKLVLGIALSLTLDLLVAQAMAVAVGWRPGAGIAALAAICLCGVVLEPARPAERSADGR